MKSAIAKLKAKARRLWVLYRLTPEEHARIRQFQKDHPVYSQLLGRLEGTDHNHITGEVRGKLDWRVNRAYGLLEKAFPKNLSEVLKALAVYHDAPPAELALGEKRYGLIGQAKYKKRMVYGPPKKTK